ncbi:MAG: hypothetical protein L0G87_06900 [Renibacterium salmoninarum]|nr:hypothetical protein [Renibacterium salmoninarum]
MNNTMSKAFGRRGFLSLAVLTGAAIPVLSASPASAKPTSLKPQSSGAIAREDRPSEADTAKLNQLRNQFGLPVTAFSDITTVVQGEDPKSFGYTALTTLGEAYAADTSQSWSKRTVDTESAHFFASSKVDPAPNDPSAQRLPELRKKLSDAMSCISLASTGMWANALYNNGGSATYGGDKNFPLYPSDLSYLLNGSSGEPDAGREKASLDIAECLRNKAIQADYSNALINRILSGFSLNQEPLTPLEWRTKLITGQTSSGYQKYLVEVVKDPALSKAEKYWHAREMATITILDPAGTSLQKISAGAASSYLAQPFEQFVKGEFPAADSAYDVTMQRYTLENLEVGIGASSLSTLRKATSAIAGILELLPNSADDLPGLDRSVAIRNTFMRLTAFEFVGESNGEFTNAQISQAVAETDTVFTNNVGAKAKLVDGLNTLNSHGVLGSVSAVLSITRLVYKSLALNDKIAKQKVTPATALGFAGSVFSTYSALGSLRTLLVTFLSKAQTTSKAAASLAGFNLAAPEVYELSSGVAWRGIIAADNVSNTTATALRSLSEEGAVAIQPRIDVSGSSVEQALNSTLDEALAKLPSGRRSAARAAIMDQVEASASAAVMESVVAGTGLAASSARLGARVFTASLALAGVIGDLLAFSYDVVSLSSGESQGASGWLFLTSDALALVSSGLGLAITFEIIASAAAGVVAMTLGFAAAVFGLVAVILAFINATSPEREATTTTFQRLQNAGYVTDWGRKIAFASVYFDTLQTETLTGNQVLKTQKRWIDDLGQSLFGVQGTAFARFTSSSANGDYAKFKDSLDSLVGVPQDIISRVRNRPWPA